MGEYHTNAHTSPAPRRLTTDPGRPGRPEGMSSGKKNKHQGGGVGKNDTSHSPLIPRNVELG